MRYLSLLANHSSRYSNQQLSILRRQPSHYLLEAATVVFDAGRYAILMRLDDRGRSWSAIRTSNNLPERNFHRHSEFFERR